jgi:cation transport ATPase
MDVPVALGLIAAFAPSAWACWTQRGHVYFDSATMFAAFLLTARYLELCARQSTPASEAAAWIEARHPALSAWADRLAGRFTAIQLLLTLAAALVWQYAGGGVDATMPIIVAMLVISCPCAMAMAAPTAVAAAHAALAARPGMGEADARALQQAMLRTARVSLHASLAWHLLLMPLAMLGWVAPQIAALTMLASSLAVAGNAWRLRRRYALNMAAPDEAVLDEAVLNKTASARQPLGGSMDTPA